MRIATTTIYKQGAAELQRHSSVQAKLQNQLSTGRRVLTPADDPISSAKILDVTQAQELNKQYAVNSQTADSAMRLSESTLQQVTDLLHDIYSLAVKAGNPSQTLAEKKLLDSELQGQYQEMMSLANATDGGGSYLFSGFKGSTQPFSETSFGNVTYAGDDGQRQMQISGSRQIPVSESGYQIFQAGRTGNGNFVSSANAVAPGNTGSGVISPGEVVDITKWNNPAHSQKFKIEFKSVDDPAKPGKPVIAYDIIDNQAMLADGVTANPNFNKSAIDGYNYTAGARPAVPGALNNYPRAYVPGGDIVFKNLASDPVGVPPVAPWDYGIKMNVTGQPSVVIGPLGTNPAPTGPVSSGVTDSFNVDPSRNNGDIFQTMKVFSDALNTYQTSPTGMANFQNQLNTVLQNTSNMLTNVLSSQGNLGARMIETQSVQDTNGDLKVQYGQTLSQLQDLDYSTALSDFSLTQTLLEASRKSFSQVQGLSLFQYIS
ncbi:flagellar hook-associated protein FlgL [Iodobacter fluviatilis]|uniref:Flagellar hook-associated protein 3 FlgL n=1 Tax=Iodobacter fluviatilis TaxID=537 RepID=A0A377Q5F5_9NEIS|nr:flagellar hook-associated protein FlgL [Iodobacter fluviatilis]TCU89106.1 flagellar hook-associated protein 3 FlgL [Iodobacter fluviatilis]STQ90474.1 Hook-filament junction protein [Iodobacter fluviatilis]